MRTESGARGPRKSAWIRATRIAIGDAWQHPLRPLVIKIIAHVAAGYVIDILEGLCRIIG